MRFTLTILAALAVVALAAAEALAGDATSAAVARGGVPAAAAAQSGVPTSASVNPSTPSPAVTQVQGATSSGAVAPPLQGPPSNPAIQSLSATQMQAATSTQGPPTGGNGQFPNVNPTIFASGATPALRANANSAITNVTNPTQQWRYQNYNNQTWYVTPQNRWMVNGPNGWSYANTNSGGNVGVPNAVSPSGAVGIPNVSGGYFYAPNTAAGAAYGAYPMYNNGYFPNSSYYSYFAPPGIFVR